MGVFDILQRFGIVCNLSFLDPSIRERKKGGGKKNKNKMKGIIFLNKRAKCLFFAQRDTNTLVLKPAFFLTGGVAVACCPTLRTQEQF